VRCYRSPRPAVPAGRPPMITPGERFEIRPDHQGGGIGTRLISALIRYGRSSPAWRQQTSRSPCRSPARAGKAVKTSPRMGRGSSTRAANLWRSGRRAGGRADQAAVSSHSRSSRRLRRPPLFPVPLITAVHLAEHCHWRFGRPVWRSISRRARCICRRSPAIDLPASDETASPRRSDRYGANARVLPSGRQ
jgi:hypothetical protein